MKHVIVVAMGLLWAAVLFVVVGYLTFPGEAVAKRVEWQVSDGSRGAYALDLGEVSPWWIGLSTDSIKLYNREGRRGPAEKLMMIATQGSMAAGVFSLMQRQPRVSGSMTLGLEGELDYVIGTSLNEKGDELLLTELVLNGDNFPIAELLAVLPGAEMTGTGNLDIEVNVQAPNGLSKADGTISIKGSGLNLVEPVVMDFPLGRDVALDGIDLEFDVDEGNAKIVRGRIDSDVANIELSGSLSLKDDPNMSNMDILVEIEMDESMSMVKQMLASAEKDGKLVYRCTGPISRIDRGCRADGKKVASRPTRTRPTPVIGEKGGEDAAVDRRERRKELQERLKRRREQREKEGGSVARRPGDKDDADDEDEDDIPEDEEDLIPEDEEELLIDEDVIDDPDFIEE